MQTKISTRPDIKIDFFDVLMAYSRNLIFVKDEKFRIVFANQSFLKLYPPQQRNNILGTTTTENFSAEQAKVFFAEDRKAFETGFSEITEEITDYQGHTMTNQTQKILFHDSNGTPYILGISTDISRMAAREKALAESNLALENFAALAAHDLRSPLSTMQSCIEMIRKDSQSKMGSQAGKFLTLMDNSLQGLIEQITGLLANYKANRPETAQRMECDVSMILEEVKFNLMDKIKDARAMVLSNSLPEISVNRPMFRQLLHNLIENSIKYRSKDTPIVIVRHRYTPKADIFSVEDNGNGIDSKQHAAIFNLHQQGDKENEGCGIGLALCHKIVAAHGGQIWIDPEFKGGAKFMFSIPR